MQEPISVADFRTLARRRLPSRIFDYVDGGSESELGLRRNRSAFERIVFLPQRLVDVSVRDMSTKLLGQTIPAPLLIAPTGLNGLVWPRGDIELARAAQRSGIPFVMSTLRAFDVAPPDQCETEHNGEQLDGCFKVDDCEGDVVDRAIGDAGSLRLVIVFNLRQHLLFCNHRVAPR
jgi:isopentenyl diphosphate isomerase/L-lactate dehydrogenase-like FMN-dependent dehydrogenase